MSFRIIAGIVIISVALVLTGCGKKRHFAPGPAPISPSNLTGTAIFSTQINLSWEDNSTDEKGFYVYRKSSDYAKVATLAADSTSYGDISLNPGTTYSYKVTAYNDGGESDSSNEVSVTTLPSAPPLAPSDLTTTIPEWNVIRLSWDDNSSNEDGFYVYGDTTGEYSKIARLVANSTSFDDTSVSFSSGITYWYKVTAYNEDGESASSNEVSVSIPPGW